jgi:hypothetical protein
MLRHENQSIGYIGCDTCYCDYMHKQVNGFLQACVDNMWRMRGPTGPPFLVLIIPSLNNVLGTLQKMQATYILHCAMVVRLTTSYLPSLVDPPAPPHPHIQLTHSYKYMSKYVLNGYWG